MIQLIAHNRDLEERVSDGLCIVMRRYSSLCGCALGLILGGFDIVEVDVQDREQVDSVEKVQARDRERKKTKQGNNQRTLKHVTSWMACGWSECARCDTLSQDVSVIKVKYIEKKSRVRCICLHTPSVTVDRYRLETKPTVTKKKFEQLKIL